MKCAGHSEVDAAGYCRNCGKAMCPACVRPVRDVLYCEECLASIVGIPAPVPAPPVPPPPAESQYQMPGAGLPPPPPPRYVRSNPVLAFFLGFLPGMGAFYNEQFGKGMMHLAIFLVLFITGIDSNMSGGATAALWICIAGLWIYMPVDAYRTAKARQMGETLSAPLDSFTKERPIGPILLIGAGVLLLLHNFDWFPWYRISQFFLPAVLIAAGVLF